MTFPLFISCTTSGYNLLVFVGTYTDKGSEGIYSCQFNPVTGDVSATKLAAVTENPSFITIDPRGKFLYAVNETDIFNNKPTGAVSVFAIDRESGNLKLLDKVSSLGAAPAYLSMDKSGQFLMVANYNGGNFAVFPVGKDGRPGKNSAFIQNAGSGVDPERQTGPHAHFIQVTDDNRFVMVADLGIDKILIYKFDASDGSLTPANPGFVMLDPGAGPRHLAFAPSGKFMYVVNELTSTVSAFAGEPGLETLHMIQTISTLPSDFSGENSTAQIVVDATGRFLYVSNRGHDSIAVIGIHPETGRLQLVEWVPSGGKTPRNFAIDPTGKWLLAANQDSDNIILFRIDQESGRLVMAPHSLDVYSPVCITFLSLK